MERAKNSAALRLSHLSLGVSDLEVSERFYRDVLGLPTQRSGDEIEVHWPDFLLILSSRPPAARGKFHFGFQVASAADVDIWAERLRAGGVNIMSGPFGEGRERQIYFVDPDNYEIEIYYEA